MICESLSQILDLEQFGEPRSYTITTVHEDVRDISIYAVCNLLRTHLLYFAVVLLSSEDTETLVKMYQPRGLIHISILCYLVLDVLIVFAYKCGYRYRTHDMYMLAGVMVLGSTLVSALTV